MKTADRVALISALWVGLVGTWAVSSTFAQSADLEEAKRLNNQVLQLYQQGKYAEAAPLAQKALNLREKALGPDHPDVAQSLNNLAALYDDQGQYAQAEPLLKRSLAIGEKALGPDHPDVAMGLNNLAALYRKSGREKEAEGLEKRAAAIRAIKR